MGIGDPLGGVNRLPALRLNDGFDIHGGGLGESLEGVDPCRYQLMFRVRADPSNGLQIVVRNPTTTQRVLEMRDLSECFLKLAVRLVAVGGLHRFL